MEYHPKLFSLRRSRVQYRYRLAAIMVVYQKPILARQRAQERFKKMLISLQIHHIIPKWSNAFIKTMN